MSMTHGRHMNAIRHGLRSDAILLEGDDAAEFHRLRHDLFRMYRPLTPGEARCVEQIAGLQWRTARCARWAAIFDGKLDTLLTDTTGDAAQRQDPDPHRWQHRGDDCSRTETRLDRAMLRTERRLFELQRMRRLGLLADAPPGQAVLAPSRLPSECDLAPDAMIASPGVPTQAQEGLPVGRASPPVRANSGGDRGPIAQPQNAPWVGRASVPVWANGGGEGTLTDQAVTKTPGRAIGPTLVPGGDARPTLRASSTQVEAQARATGGHHGQIGSYNERASGAGPPRSHGA